MTYGEPDRKITLSIAITYGGSGSHRALMRYFMPLVAGSDRDVWLNVPQLCAEDITVITQGTATEA